MKIKTYNQLLESHYGWGIELEMEGYNIEDCVYDLMLSVMMEPDTKKLVEDWAKKNRVVDIQGRLVDDLYDVSKRQPKKRKGGT